MSSSFKIHAIMVPNSIPKEKVDQWFATNNKLKSNYGKKEKAPELKDGHYIYQ